jgi:uncharacterized phage protein (TIGR02218 family)
MTLPIKIQSVQYSDPSGANPSSVTLPNPPVQGNLLLLVLVGTGFNTGVITGLAPGWNIGALVNDTGAGNCSGAGVFYKYAGAGESATQSPFTLVSNFQPAGALWELGSVSGVWATDFVEAQFDQTNNVATLTHAWSTSIADEGVFGAMGGGYTWFFGGTGVAPTPTGSMTVDQSHDHDGGVFWKGGFVAVSEGYPTSGTSVSETITFSGSQDQGLTSYMVGIAGTTPVGEGDYAPGAIDLVAPTWGAGPASAHYAPGVIAMTAPSWSAHSSAQGDYAPGTIAIDAGAWAATVKAGVSEVDIAGLVYPETNAAISEIDIAVIGTPTLTSAQVGELDVAALAQPATNTHGSISEVEVSVLGYAGPAETYRCQAWKLVRKDGQVFAFTSLDRDIEWGGVTYRTCNSLSSSASESAADLSSVGNVELAGILDDAAIKQADLYAGLFDDAFVDVWVIPYNGEPDDQAPFRVAAGWTGKVVRMEGNFTAEILGGGARLQQAALVRFITPGCSWDFGVMNDKGIGCPVDAEARKVAGAIVTSSALRSVVHFSGAVDPGGTSIWNGGTIVWTSGLNAGVSCQVDTLDWGAPALSLWDLAPYPPAPGDTFDIKPGCPYTSTACKQYGAYLSFGGYDNVPGPDALQSNADSLFT